MTTRPPAQSEVDDRNMRLVSLLADCERGNEAAFETLYGLCSAQLYGVLLRILKTDAIAEEALQEAFIKIWQKSGTFSSENGSPMAWMCSIARNQGLDVLRRRGVREARENADVDGQIESFADISKPLSDMSDDAALLIQCLELLPEDVSQCIVSAYCEGYTNDELSQRYEAPTGTVKSWIRRGLISLRKCIDERA